MRAWVLEAVRAPLVLAERPLPVPGAGEALVRVHAVALNRRDHWITLGLYPGARHALPAVLGSDGCGVVVAVGDDAHTAWVGRDVVLNPGERWGESEDVQGAGFNLLGLTRPGTLAEHVLIAVDRLVAKPSHLTAVQASTLGVAAHTAYRALFTKGAMRAGQRVLVTGIGSGVAAFAAQFAKAAGATVHVTSSSAEKVRWASDTLGVDGGATTAGERWIEALSKTVGSVDLLVDGVGGDVLTQCIRLVRPGGKIVSYGATAGQPPDFPIAQMFLLQKQLLGDFANMVELVSEKALIPPVDSIHAFADVPQAMALLASGKQRGKIVVSIAPMPKQ